jgi:hypothetical protein
MIMRLRPANISLINRRHYPPRLPLTLSSTETNDQRTLTGHYISTVMQPHLSKGFQQQNATPPRQPDEDWQLRVSCPN